MKRFQVEALVKVTRKYILPSSLCQCRQKPFSLPSSLSPLNFQNPSFKPFTFPLHFHFLSSQHNFSILPNQTFCSFTTSRASDDTGEDEYETEQNLVIEEWEEEDDTDPEFGDGGAGGGIVLQNLPWGERALSIAREVLVKFGDDIKLYSFKTTPHGYVYVRLDQLSKEYGCPNIELLESYSREYKKHLEEEGSKGELPIDLALEVSSPGAERLLRVPEDLLRFKDYPMVVSYFEGVGGTETKPLEKSGIYFLDSVENESEQCVWKLADVKENKDPASKGRPMSRKRRDWRLNLPFSMLKK